MRKTIVLFLILVVMGMASCSSNEDEKDQNVFRAINNGDMQAVKDFIRKYPEAINIKDSEDGITLLHYAVMNNRNVNKGNIDVVKLLISQRADVNAKDNKGITPLHLAVIKCNIDVAKLLISKGADVNATDKYSRTPLHYVAFQGNIDLAKLLISKGADVNVKDKFGETPLKTATGSKGNFEVYAASHFQNASHEVADLLRKHGGKE